MRKISFVIIIISLLVLALFFSPSKVKATCTDCVTPSKTPTPTPTPTMLPVVESWDAGTEFELDTAVYPAPEAWEQAMAKGVKVDGPGKICHPFRKGAYGWTGSIYQLSENGWVKLPTTLGWIPNEEGVYKACAYAPAAGTYAFFGYYDPDAD
jgi:hypothetical protein